jgi:F-type H+-transporting ATPase subunit alpha
MAAFAQFGSELDKATQAQLNRGQRMVELLKQAQYTPLPVEKQILIIFAGTAGHLDDVPLEAVAAFEQELYRFVETVRPEVLRELAEKREITDPLREKMTKAVVDFKADFLARLKKGAAAAAPAA